MGEKRGMSLQRKKREMENSVELEGLQVRIHNPRRMGGVCAVRNKIS